MPNSNGETAAARLCTAAAGDLPGILGIYNEVILSSADVYIDDPVSPTKQEAWLAER